MRAPDRRSTRMPCMAQLTRRVIAQLLRALSGRFSRRQCPATTHVVHPRRRCAWFISTAEKGSLLEVGVAPAPFECADLRGNMVHWASARAGAMAERAPGGLFSRQERARRAQLAWSLQRRRRPPKGDESSKGAPLVTVAGHTLGLTSGICTYGSIAGRRTQLGNPTVSQLIAKYR